MIASWLALHHIMAHKVHKKQTTATNSRWKDILQVRGAEVPGSNEEQDIWVPHQLENLILLEHTIKCLIEYFS